ncbi:hemerythrin domain-containing protein [Rhodococcus erythropolis]|uniref:hemerythrin domain-containing protein n=1 Tax=Rhodococcus erythropolis TaxID=1833 RepID=UPI001BE67120|nr:hemerythrin domain-containing protein [Rhodococcus erythropolis]MBT2264412.1 hemerythrin domain-containing protein [Rhodococcus erythropolis]
MDALAFLRADHESVLGMLEALDEVPRAGGAGLGARNDMVTTLVMAESEHEAVEEQFFWPAVRRMVEGGDELADRGVAQEDAAKRILQILEDGEAGDPVFEQALARFIEAAREHIEYEQDQVWPRVREAMTAADLEELGKQMARAKPMAPTRPHPQTPSDPTVLKTVGMAAAALDKVRDKVSGRDGKKPPQAPPA